MPEGPEVKIISDVIRAGIGKLFSKIEIIEQPHFKHRFVRDGITDIEHFQDQFTITEVMTAGKLIDIGLDNGKEKFSALNTLGMSGTWAWNSRSHRHARVNFVGIDSPDLTFIDQRCFGTFKIVSPSESWNKLVKIGWDLLDGPMPESNWLDLQKKPTIASQDVGVALMNQKHFAGIGNIYKAEILYECGIHPSIKVSDLTPQQWQSINMTAHKILKESYVNGGSSVKDYTANGTKGHYQHKLKVYNRKFCPQNHSVSTSVQKKRTTWYCATCQK